MKFVNEQWETFFFYSFDKKRINKETKGTKQGKHFAYSFVAFC